MTRPTISIGSRGNGTTGLPIPSGSETGLGIFTGIGGTPARLGGPKAADSAPLTATGKTDFLRGVHASACRIFGTVLGPEANSAHRNHFHVDMAERKLRSICE
jgi:Extensin-like protein C-terminus